MERTGNEMCENDVLRFVFGVNATGNHIINDIIIEISSGMFIFEEIFIFSQNMFSLSSSVLYLDMRSFCFCFVFSFFASF